MLPVRTEIWHIINILLCSTLHASVQSLCWLELTQDSALFDSMTQPTYTYLRLHLLLNNSQGLQLGHI